MTEPRPVVFVHDSPHETGQDIIPSPERLGRCTAGPWMNTAAMSQHDLRAICRYIHSLGARGTNAPRAVPPDSTPRTPYINFVPVQP